MDYVFLHGTTQSPAGWDRVVSALDRPGHRTHRPDLLTGRRDAVAADYVAAVRRQLPPDVREPVVVVHSGAGLLVPALAPALGARHVVWLAAAVPDLAGGASFLDQVAASGEAMFTEEWRGLTEPPTADPVTSAYFLFHDCDLATLRWALSTVRLWHPAGLYTEPPSPGPPPPSTYVLPTQDRTLHPAWMLRTARERLGAEVVEVEAGHCPQVGLAGEVAAIVEGAAA